MTTWQDVLEARENTRKAMERRDAVMAEIAKERTAMWARRSRFERAGRRTVILGIAAAVAAFFEWMME